MYPHDLGVSGSLRVPRLGPTAIVCLSPAMGGMELDAARLARMLAVHGKVVLIVRFGGYLHLTGGASAKGSSVAVESIKFGTSFSWRLIRSAREILKSYGIKNVILFGSSELKSLFFSVRGMDVRLVVRHGTTKSTGKNSWLHRLLYRRVAAHVAVSRHIERNVRQVFPLFPGQDVSMIYLSTQYPAAQVLRRPRDVLRIVHVGRVCQGKGQDFAIMACRALREAGTRFTLEIVGDTTSDPRYLDDLRHLVREQGLEESVRFVGHADRPYPYMRDADIFLFPSAGEGFSNVVAEALVAGLVIVVFDNTVMPEIRSLGFHMHLIPDGDKNSLAQALLQISRNIDSEKQLSLANAHRAVEIFSAERERGEYVELLERLQDRGLSHPIEPGAEAEIPEI